MINKNFIIAAKITQNPILNSIKVLLTSNDFTFLGFVDSSFNLMRAVRQYYPDLVIIHLQNNFEEYKQSIDIIDNSLLASCLLLFESGTNKAIMNMIEEYKVVNYITKPVFEEPLIQIADFSLLNIQRIKKYENKIKTLHETIENKKIIERAKWILVKSDAITEQEAYERIMRKSRDNRMPMHKIAEAIIIAKG